MQVARRGQAGVRDSPVTRDASCLCARSCGGIGVAQMLRQQAQDVDAAEEVELRRLEGHPEACRAVAVLAVLLVCVVADGERDSRGSEV